MTRSPPPERVQDYHTLPTDPRGTVTQGAARDTRTITWRWARCAARAGSDLRLPMTLPTPAQYQLTTYLMLYLGPRLPASRVEGFCSVYGTVSYEDAVELYESEVVLLG